jgi:DNA-binding NarL/FixJ family response regulator
MLPNIHGYHLKNYSMTQDNDIHSHAISRLFATSPDFQLVGIWKDEECIIHVHIKVTGSGEIRQTGQVDPLTKREAEVLLLLAEGKMYKEVAFRLGITMETVKKHTRHIYSKLKVQNRMEAVNKWRLRTTEKGVLFN